MLIATAAWVATVAVRTVAAAHVSAGVLCVCVAARIAVAAVRVAMKTIVAAARAAAKAVASAARRRRSVARPHAMAYSVQTLYTARGRATSAGV